MPDPHAPRHAAAPVVPVPFGAVGWRQRVRRGLWIPMAGFGAYLVLAGSAALGLPGLDAPFLPQPSTVSREPGQTGAEVTQDADPTVPMSPTTVPSVSPSATPTDSAEPTLDGEDEPGTASVEAGGQPTEAEPEPTQGAARPTPTPSASSPGKSGSAPGATKKPPKPKP